MSEQKNGNSTEHIKSPDTKEVRAQLDRLGEKLSEQAENSRSETDSLKQTREAREDVERHALSSKEHAPEKSEEKQRKSAVGRGHKKMTYRSTMRRVESKLPAYQRVFSKIIHSSAIDASSAVIGRTIARPSAVIGAGATAFIGLVVVTYYANQLGFQVSASLFVVLIAIGWLIGLVLEFGIATIRRLIGR